MIKCRNSRVLKKITARSKEILIDDNSKVVFISDVHRGDGGNTDSLRMNKNIYKAALEFYYNKNYILTELGDGDELWKNKNLKDIAYNYKDIFEILNKFNDNNKLYMVYGNHDIIKSDSGLINKCLRELKIVSENFGTEIIKLYSSINFYESVIFKYKDKKIIGFHGHQVDFINCDLWKISRFLVRYFWRNMENIAGFKEPTSPSSNYNKGDEIDRILQKLAQKEKKIIICGHTHNDVFMYPKEGFYFNDGCCVFPSSVTSIEIENGKISLVKWSMEVNKEKFIYINRSIIEGPCRIEEYFD